jgi:hypothetical protein
LQAAVAGPILGIDFLRKFKVTVSPDTSQVQFACTLAAPSASNLFTTVSSASSCLSSPTPVRAPVPIQPSTATTSPRNPEVKTSAFSPRQNQPFSTPPLAKNSRFCAHWCQTFAAKIPLYPSHWGCEADTYPRGRASHPYR